MLHPVGGAMGVTFVTMALKGIIRFETVTSPH